MKKRVFIVVFSVFVLLLLGAFYKYNNSKKIPNILGVQDIPLVTLILREESSVATYSGITAHTPYEALTVVSQKYAIPVKTKQYDFGVFVEAIGTQESGKEYSWLYFVNDTSGTIASDKKELRQGDVVTWRYMKASF